MTAVVVVSESELKKTFSDWTQSYPFDNPESFNKILYSMGLDVNRGVELQENFVHRNRLNEVVVCNRWVGMERLDDEWVSSRYASREARNEASGSKLLKDLDPHRFHEV